MAKRKATAAARAGSDRGSRWTVRGVPPKMQRAAGDAARARGLTLGQWLTELLGGAVDADALAAPATAATGWSEAIERRLERLERAVFAGDSPAPPAPEPSQASL